VRQGRLQVRTVCPPENETNAELCKRDGLSDETCAVRERKTMFPGCGIQKQKENFFLKIAKIYIFSRIICENFPANAKKDNFSTENNFSAGRNLSSK